MAEKRRGLGRGLGSLIPSQEPGRPSDVFFPRGERSADAPTDGSEEQAKERRSSDPAESMRRAQAGRRTGTAKRSTSRAKATTGDAATTAPTAAKPTAGKTGAAKGAAAKSGAEKTAATKRGVTKATGAAKATGSAGRAAASTAAAKTATKTTPQQVDDPAAVTDDSEARPDVTENHASVDSNTPKSTVTTSRSKTESVEGSPEGAAEPVNASSASNQPSVDGVYVSRETVLTHSSSTDSAEAEVESDDPLPSLADADGGPVEDDQIGQEADVPRETAGSRGYDDEFDDLVPVPGTTFGEIELDLIRPNPRQPRDVFDEDALEELVTSIREIGVLQPVVVRRRPEMPGHYELIMGERRFRASKEAGKKTIPAIVRATADDDLLRDALLENLHRVDLNPLEEAAAYAQLLEDFNCTQEELSTRIGRSRPQISNTLRLLKLPAMVQRRVAAGVLSSGHARALLGLTDGANMEVLAQRVVAEGLSVRATEEAVILLNRGDRMTVSRGTREANPELAELARSLGDRLDTRVNVVMGKRKGKLSVEFANGDDLSRILSLLGLEGSAE